MRTRSPEASRRYTHSIWPWILAAVPAVCYLLVSALSSRFEYGQGHAQRPIPAVLSLFLIASACYLAFLFTFALRRRPLLGYWSDRQKLLFVIGWAIAYRMILLPSNPIQEIDYYRYLWDGRVLLSGENPYRYAPRQIDEAAAEAPADLRRLRSLAARSDALATIFARVHHREVPTVYPPAAQLVFALSALCTPVEAPVFVHVIVLKAWLTAFDIGVIALVMLILSRLRLPPIWAAAYAWCPLILKEFANTGHLDAIAVFFTALAAYLTVRLLQRGVTESRRPMPLALTAAVSLAAAVLAKSYPLVLLPVLAGAIWYKLRWRMLVPLATFAAALIVAYLPFLGTSPGPSLQNGGGPPSKKVAQNTPFTGLHTFLTRWQMNDFLFMLLHENLRPPTTATERSFVIVPGGIRRWLNAIAVDVMATTGIGQGARDPAFLLTQCIMGTIVGFLSLWFGLRLARAATERALLEGFFLVLAWFWLLSAAPNPWYLSWCLPFVVFQKRWSWYLLPCMAFMYYVHFYLEYLVWPDPVGLQRVRDLYNYGLVWIEYGPFLLLLAAEKMLGPFCRRAEAQFAYAGDDRRTGRRAGVKRRRMRKAS